MTTDMTDLSLAYEADVRFDRAGADPLTRYSQTHNAIYVNVDHENFRLMVSCAIEELRTHSSDNAEVGMRAVMAVTEGLRHELTGDVQNLLDERVVKDVSGLTASIKALGDVYCTALPEAVQASIDAAALDIALRGNLIGELISEAMEKARLYRIVAEFTKDLRLTPKGDVQAAV